MNSNKYVTGKTLRELSETNLYGKSVFQIIEEEALKNGLNPKCLGCMFADYEHPNYCNCPDDCPFEKTKGVVNNTWQRVKNTTAKKND